MSTIGSPTTRNRRSVEPTPSSSSILPTWPTVTASTASIATATAMSVSERPGWISSNASCGAFAMLLAMVGCCMWLQLLAFGLLHHVDVVASSSTAAIATATAMHSRLAIDASQQQQHDTFLRKPRSISQQDATITIDLPFQQEQVLDHGHQVSSNAHEYNTRTRRDCYVTTAVLVDYFANNGYAQALDTMQYPMSEYCADIETTFAAFQGPHEEPYVAAYQHDQQKWIGPFQVGVRLLGNDAFDPMLIHDDRTMALAAHDAAAAAVVGGADPVGLIHSMPVSNNHGKPALILNDAGYLLISFGAHGGDPALAATLGDHLLGDYSGGQQQLVRSARPRDIAGPWQVSTPSSSSLLVATGLREYNSSNTIQQKPSKSGSLSWNGCYAQWIKVGSDLFHFVRHLAHVSSWTYQRSSNHGQSFQPVQAILRTTSQPHEPVKDNWSCCFRPGVLPGKTNAVPHLILAVCVYQKHWMPRNNSLESYNVYYMTMNPITETWYNVKGQPIRSMPITKERADSNIRVLKTESITVASLLSHGAVPLSSGRRSLNQRRRRLSQPIVWPIQHRIVNGSNKNLNLLMDHHSSHSFAERFPYKYVHPGSVVLDRHGHPHLLIKFAVSGTVAGSDVGRGHKKLFHIGWNGTAWSRPVAITGEHPLLPDWITASAASKGTSAEAAILDEDGDIDIDVDATTLRVTLASVNETHSYIMSYHSTDQGRSWQAQTFLYATLKDEEVLKISALVRHGHVDARIAAYGIRHDVVTNKTRALNDDDGHDYDAAVMGAYRRMYLLGDHGPIQRPAIEARICQR